jgi:hypothetical protein
MSQPSTTNDCNPLSRFESTVFNAVKCCYPSTEEGCCGLDIEFWWKYHSGAGVDNNIFLKIAINGETLHLTPLHTPSIMSN